MGKCVSDYFCFQIMVPGVATRKISSVNKCLLLCLLRRGQCWGCTGAPALLELQSQWQEARTVTVGFPVEVRVRRAEAWGVNKCLLR